jgi:hypothetical protein
MNVHFALELGFVFFRLVDGKLAEHWAQTDTLGLLREADIVERPGALI